MNSFDLETAIGTWRSFFETRRAFFDEDLEELENHLRELTDDLIQSGMSEENAFRQASAHLGSVIQLDEEYKNVFWRKIKHQDKLLKTVIFQLAMFKNYIKIGLRNLVKHKGYSALNISGLAVGLACSFFAFLWIQDELSVDQFHDNGDLLYQVKINAHNSDQISTWSNAPLPLAETIESNYPEIESAILMMPMKAAISMVDHASHEKGFFVSAGFFDAFTFPLITGDQASVLTDPSSIVISASVASKYFGQDWRSSNSVLGQTFSMAYWQSNGGVLGDAVTVESLEEFTITGIFEDVPRRSSLQFDIILPVQVVLSRFDHLKEWGPRWFEMIVKVRPDSDASVLSEKIQGVLQERLTDADGKQDIILQSFGKTYLHGSFVQGQPSGGRIQRVYLIGLVGLAILLIACINFTNLTTARSNQRAQEIGVRKAMGATPSFLIQQFLGEAVLTSLVAFVVAIGLLIVVLPLFNGVANTDIAASSLTGRHWLNFLVIALVTGVVAGGYPALYLASMNVIRVFRSQSSTGRKGEINARKSLVVIQFSVSVFLIVGTLTVYEQLSFLQTKDLGLDKENVVMMRLDGELDSQYEAVRQALSNSSSIEYVSRTSAHPLGVAIKNQNVVWEGKQTDESILFTVLKTDDQFAKTMKLDVVEGRFFEDERDRGLLRYVVNESAVRAMRLTNPVGHPFAFGYDVDGSGPGSGQIVGVVNDFHTGSLTDEKIGPLVFRLESEGANFMLARLKAGRTSNGIVALSEMSEFFNPGYPFDYEFLDERYGAYYADEMVLGTLSQVFAFIAVLIACLGLLGLSAFSVQQRTKEIGVRQILGATKGHVMFILSTEFMKLVIISLVIAMPLAYWAMTNWLTSFAYRIDMGLGTLFIAGALSLSVALMTVGYQAHRATRQNPVQALRYE